MKKIISMIFLAILAFPLVVYANSSWRWISETRPHDVLPFVVIITLLIETLAIIKIAHIKEYANVFLCTLFGNILSFAAPYLFAMTDELYSFRQMLKHTPYYTVGLAYLLSTLAIEYPVVYNCLKKFATNKKTLTLTILCSNLLTTIITAVVEHIFCTGQW